MNLSSTILERRTPFLTDFLRIGVVQNMYHAPQKHYLLLSRERISNRILRSDLQKDAATALANYGCGRSGHLQNGKPARRKNPEEMGKQMENHPPPEMATEMEKITNKMTKIHFRGRFSISVAIFRPFRALQ